MAEKIISEEIQFGYRQDVLERIAAALEHIAVAQIVAPMRAKGVEMDATGLGHPVHQYNCGVCDPQEVEE